MAGIKFDFFQLKAESFLLAIFLEHGQSTHLKSFSQVGTPYFGQILSTKNVTDDETHLLMHFGIARHSQNMEVGFKLQFQTKHNYVVLSFHTDSETLQKLDCFLSLIKKDRIELLGLNSRGCATEFNFFRDSRHESVLMARSFLQILYERYGSITLATKANRAGCLCHL